MVGKEYSGDLAKPEGVLVVGMGDEARGDGGVGVHLVNCLAQMDWPSGIHFCAADESVPQRAGQFARVILLDALEGPASPGSLYQLDPQDLADGAAGGPDSGMGLLTMLPESVRKRVAVFGVHPRTSSWGAPLSRDVLAALSMLLTYLRARILSAAGELTQAN
jgi:hydrogenase maturation protease